jgi:hypothetical protein
MERRSLYRHVTWNPGGTGSPAVATLAKETPLPPTTCSVASAESSDSWNGVSALITLILTRAGGP